MMSEPNIGPEIVGAKVRLLPNFDEVYQLAYVGSLATIKDFMIDEYGYPKVWVEWDQDDWRFNNEPDQWTYPEHFEVIRPPVSIEQMARNVVREISEPCPHCGESHPQDPEIAKYMDTITEAFDDASGSEAFLLVAITQVDAGDYDELVPVITTATWSDEATEILNATLSQISRTAHNKGPKRGGMHGPGG